MQQLNEMTNAMQQFNRKQHAMMKQKHGEWQHAPFQQNAKAEFGPRRVKKLVLKQKTRAERYINYQEQKKQQQPPGEY